MPPRKKRKAPEPSCSQVPTLQNTESTRSATIDLTQAIINADNQSDGEAKSEGARLKWTDEMHEALLEKLYEHFQLGKHTDGGGFKADTWTQAVEAVRRVYQGDSAIEETSCHNKWTWFKDTWKN
jgi:hypothetical protein